MTKLILEKSKTELIKETELNEKLAEEVHQQHLDVEAMHWDCEACLRAYYK